MSIRSQGTNLFTGVLVVVATGFIVQLWLLTVSMEALLRQQNRILIPAAIGSTVLLAINAGLLRYVFRFDKDAQHGDQE